LNREKNYISDIVNSMPSVIVCLDNRGRITRWNKSAERKFSLNEADVLGQAAGEIINYLSLELSAYYNQDDKKKDIKVLKKYRREKNIVIYEEISLYPLTDSNNGDVVLRIDDITEKVRIQEALVQSEKMLSVGGLAAGMAHEINNPLAGIMQTAEVMVKRLTDTNLPANIKAAEEAGIDLERLRIYIEKREISRMLRAISEGGQRASGIIQNMLSFSRIEHDPYSTQNPVEMLEQIVEIASTDFNLEKHYDFKKIEIIRQYEEDLPLIPCSKSQIQQVILNLLKNGAEAMKDNVERDYVPCLILRLRKGHDKLYIDVEDNGPGLSDEKQKRIFEPFFTTKPVDVGTGLGLSVSYFIITENHKGTLEVHSAPGEGALFTIGLPLHS